MKVQTVNYEIINYLIYICFIIFICIFGIGFIYSTNYSANNRSTKGKDTLLFINFAFTIILFMIALCLIQIGFFTNIASMIVPISIGIIVFSIIFYFIYSTFFG